MNESSGVMKILVTVEDEAIAGRFDMVTETVMAVYRQGERQGAPKTFLVSQPSAEELCRLIMKEEVGVLVCGGIEERHQKFLSWKGVRVLDAVIGPYAKALELAARGSWNRE